MCAIPASSLQDRSVLRPRKIFPDADRKNSYYIIVLMYKCQPKKDALGGLPLIESKHAWKILQSRQNKKQ